MKKQFINKYLSKRKDIESVLAYNNLSTIGSREVLLQRLNSLSYKTIINSIF